MRSTSVTLKAFSRVGFASASNRAATAFAPRGNSALGRLDAPRLVRHTAERDAAAAVALHDRGDRHQRKGVGGAIAHLLIEVRSTDRFGQRDRRDQLAGFERRLHMRRLARQPVELGDRNLPRRAVRTHRFDRRVERTHGHRHVARMCGDARVARADHGMLAAEAVERGAPATGLPFVARLIGVVEVGAACPLEQVAGRGGLVAQLTRRPREQRAREHTVVTPYAWIGGEVGVADERAERSPPSGVASILSRARPLTSIRCLGVSISSFIRSSRFVPPAMKRAPGVRAAADAACAGDCARS